MRLSILIITLSLFSMPTIASEKREVDLYPVGYYKSIFTKVTGYSVLNQKSQKEGYWDERAKSDFLSFSSNSKHKSSIKAWFSFSGDKENHASQYIGSGDNHPFNGYGNHEYEWNYRDEWNDDHICSPVPEPESYAYLTLGLVMIGFLKRKKNQ